MDDGSASVFCFTPLRVPVSELGPSPLVRHRTSPSSESGCSAPPLPLGPCPVCPRLEQEFEAFRQAAYWKAMHGRALQREAQLKAENQRLQALLRLREQQLFGANRDFRGNGSSGPDAPYADSPPRQPRGQQRGRPSPKRRDYSHLPAVVEDKVLLPDQCRCSRCGQPFADFPGTEDSTILEIDVRAHRRVIRRRRYRPTCSCGAHPGIVTAPPPARLIPKSMLGVSLWVTALGQVSVLPADLSALGGLEHHGLDLSLGTLTDGLKRMVPP